MAGRHLLDRETIIRAFNALEQRLAARGEIAELFLVGGAVMCLVHRARPCTKDVDGGFSNPQVARAAVGEVADIRFLATLLRVASNAEALAIVLRYFPEERLPVRARLLLEEMFDGRA